MKTLTERFIKNIELIDNTQYSNGRKRFWRDLQYYMADRDFANIEFSQTKKNIGGLFTTDIFTIDKIILPEDIAEVNIDNNSGSIKFNSDKHFAIFIHEVSHYYHLVKDNGKFMSPKLLNHEPVKFDGNLGVKKEYVIDLEYEAGYRSLYLNNLYQMFPTEDRTILELNLTNMFNYINILNRDEFNKETFKERCINYIKNAEFFTDLDYDIVI